MGKYVCHFVVFYVSQALNLFCSSVPSFLPSLAFIDFLKIIYCIYSLLISFLVYFLVVFLKSKEYSEHLKLKITLNLYHFSLSMIQKLCSLISLTISYCYYRLHCFTSGVGLALKKKKLLKSFLNMQTSSQKTF